MPELETLTVGFAQLVKYNAADGTFEGVMASERPDKAKEALDYAKSRPNFLKWSQDAKKRSNGKSLGNVREMHQLAAVGKLTSVVFDDANRRIIVKGKVVDPLARTKCEEGIYTGLSIGGSYVGEPLPDPKDPTILRYVANPSEVSLVDDPCNPESTFELIGSDGSKKVMKFAPAAVEADADEAPAPAPEPPKEPAMPEPVKIDTASLAEALKAHFANEKAAKADAKAKKLAKWTKRAEPYKVDYAKLSKAQRQDFRAAFRADRALQKVAQLRGLTVETPDAVVGPVEDANQKVEGEALQKRAPAHQPPAFAAAL